MPRVSMEISAAGMLARSPKCLVSLMVSNIVQMVFENSFSAEILCVCVKYMHINLEATIYSRRLNQ